MAKFRRSHAERTRVVLQGAATPNTNEFCGLEEARGVSASGPADTPCGAFVAGDSTGVSTGARVS